MLHPSAPCHGTLSRHFLPLPPPTTLPLEVSGKGPIVDQAVSSNSYVKILTPTPQNVKVFADRAFKEVIKVKCDLVGVPYCNVTSTPYERASLVAQMVKNLPAVWETWVWSLGRKDSLEKGMATYSSILAGNFHGQRSLGGYSPWRSQRVRHDWGTNTYKKRLGQGHAWRKKTTWIPWEKIASTSEGKNPQKEILLTWWSWTCSHQNQEERSFCCVRHLACGIHYSRLGKWKWIQTHADGRYYCGNIWKVPSATVRFKPLLSVSFPFVPSVFSVLFLPTPHNLSCLPLFWLLLLCLQFYCSSF